MKTKIRMRVLSAVLTMLLASMVMVPVSADTTAFLNEMGGKELSAGEYLEVYDPDYFSTLTNDKKAQFNAMKVTVPDLSQDVVKKSGTVEAEGDSKIIYTATNNVDLAPVPLGINWLANSKGACLFPDMHVAATLYYSSDESTWEKVDSGSDSGYVTTFVKTSNVEWLPSTGYYKVISSHMGTFPAGATSSTYAQILMTGSMHYS